jgi:hypothetical protein
MRWLLFFSRVALICNFFFLLSALLQWNNFIEYRSLVSTIVIMGYFMAVFVFNPLVTIFYAIQLLRKKNLFAVIPRWLVRINFIFLILQIIFVAFFINDTFYY